MFHIVFILGKTPELRGNFVRYKNAADFLIKNGWTLNQNGPIDSDGTVREYLKGRQKAYICFA